MVELVIKISEEDYEYIKNSNDMNFNVIKNGTPLPKGHGDLIDRKALLNRPYEEGGFVEWYDEIKHAPTIIEADKEYEAEVITRGNCMMCGKELTEGLFFCKECENKANSRK